MNPVTALALVTAMTAAVLTCRRRLVGRLGPYGPALAPSFLLIVWFESLSLGQVTGSLEGAGWVAAVPMILIGGVSVVSSRKLRRSRFRWTIIDKCVFAFLSLFLIAYCGNDNFCHYSVVGAYLRDNVPPTAFNDPSRPLRYHGLFDAAAALVTDAAGLSPESSLDLVSILCVFACGSSLQGLSRILFRGGWARQSARVFYGLGFGPIYLNHLGTFLSRLIGRGGAQPGPFLFHGQSTQSFVESIPRRPMGLNHVLFLFLLTAMLPRLTSRLRDVPPGFWLPGAFLLPLASEDLTGLCGLVVLWLWISRVLATRWVVAWGVVTLAGLPFSGVLTAMLAGSSEAVSPHLALGWPLSLPYWADLEGLRGASKDEGWSVIKRGLPLFSTGSLRVLLLEWGPLFFGGLSLGVREPRRRVIVGTVGVGFLLATCLEFRGWLKADLDRFLFYGTSAGFLLSSTWVELFEQAWKKRQGPARLGLKAAALVLVILPTVLGPVGFATRYSLYWILGKNSRSPLGFSEAELVRLRATLKAVGPRDLILTDIRYAQSLVLAGFLVDTPMAPGFSIGIVDESGLASRRPEAQPSRANWLFLPVDDPRVRGRAGVVDDRGYRLIRR